MPQYLVRKNCEYSIEVEADSEEDALLKAGEIDDDQWIEAWSPFEVESEDPPMEQDPHKRCGIREDGDEDGYRCTRTEDHDGDHVAHGPNGEMIVGWSNEE